MRPTRTPIVLAAFASLFLSSAALAQSPTTEPAKDATAIAPATSPITERMRVMLVPFQSVGEGDHGAWVSQAIDEDLANDLARNRAIVVLRPPVTLRAQPLDGLAAARSANASLLVSGSFQVVDDQLRITADVSDVNGLKSIGQLKVTGRMHDLFQLEDGLATQLWRTLPRPSGETATASSNEPGFTVTPLEQYDMGNSQGNSQGTSQPQILGPYTASSEPLIAPAPQANTYASSPDAYSSYYAPGYGYAAPYDTYPYGFYSSPFIFVGGGFNRGERGGDRGGNHGRDFHHGGGSFGHFGTGTGSFPLVPHSSLLPGVAEGPAVSRGSSGRFGGHR